MIGTGKLIAHWCSELCIDRISMIVNTGCSLLKYCSEEEDLNIRVFTIQGETQVISCLLWDFSVWYYVLDATNWHVVWYLS